MGKKKKKIEDDVADWKNLNNFKTVFTSGGSLLLARYLVCCV